MISLVISFANNTKMLTCVVTIFISILSTLLIISKWRAKKEAPLPPGPRGLPIIGYLPFLSPNLHHDFSKLAEKYGPIYKLWLGNSLCIVVGSPSLAKQLVRHQDKIMANRNVTIAAKIVTYGGLDIAMAPYGSYWRNVRKLFVRDMLSNKNLDAGSFLRKSEIKKAIKYTYHNIGKKIDVGELGFKTELNVVMTMIWGGTLNEQKREEITSEFRMLSGDLMYLFTKPNVSDFFPMLASLDLQGVEKDMKVIARKIDKIFDFVIDQRMKMSHDKEVDGKKDFLQILLELRKQNDFGLALDDSQIKAILLDIVIGGTDTTATSFEWAMAELLAHPEAIEKVKQELEDVVGTNMNIEEAHVSRLKYLDAIIKETFRLHPPIPLPVPKVPSQSSLLGGYLIPKDTQVFLNVLALHKDPQYWDNPSDFIPERFLNDDSSDYDFHGNNIHFLPFGSGRRICAGVPLAEKMLKYLLASMLQSFDWRMADGEEIDFTDKFGLVVKKKNSLLAIPSPRLQNLDIYQ